MRQGDRGQIPDGSSDVETRDEGAGGDDVEAGDEGAGGDKGDGATARAGAKDEVDASLRDEGVGATCVGERGQGQGQGWPNQG